METDNQYSLLPIKCSIKPHSKQEPNTASPLQQPLPSMSSAKLIIIVQWIESRAHVLSVGLGQSMYNVHSGQDALSKLWSGHDLDTYCPQERP